MIDFANYLSPGRKGHLIGIGGVSMSSLAEVLCGMGICIKIRSSGKYAGTRNPRALLPRKSGLPTSLGVSNSVSPPGQKT